MLNRTIITGFFGVLLLAGLPALLAGNPGTEEVEKKLKTLAVQQVKTVCESCKVTVECKWLAPAVASASDEDVTGLQFDKPGLPSGYVTGKVLIGDEPASAKTAVQLYISIHQKLPVAHRQIARGTAIGEDDISWQWKEISGLQREPLSSSEHFENQQAARLIRKGDLFYASDLTGPTSIQPGDPVSMQYGEGGVNIQINCIAREAKGVGQEIRLYSKETRRNYIAKIITENKIVWVRTL